MEIRTEITIAAPPEVVWRVLTDIHDYGWNPFMSFLGGELVRGRTLEVELGLAGTRKFTFKPKVLNVEPSRELRWRGKVLFRGLFDGEHVFQLEPSEGGGTRFLHFETFSGLLVGLMRRILERDTRPGFEAMNAALKARAEAIHGGATASVPLERSRL